MHNLICEKCGGRWLPDPKRTDRAACPWCRIRELEAALDKRDATIGQVERGQRKLFSDAKGTVDRLPNTATLAYWAGIRDCLEFWDQATDEAGGKSDG